MRPSTTPALVGHRPTRSEVTNAAGHGFDGVTAPRPGEDLTEVKQVGVGAELWVLCSKAL
ncbi:hypothetical protein CKO25_11215 [Thiocapsa imhoffii]|uniref:Uncharacterized protein n=1 Tax=Thiocapsa imhoffii TaxID=382777 RepID=A0A9X0WJC4_9GAMM|nr:hypothetical protein [Thiocapsa imhoffii]